MKKLLFLACFFLSFTLSAELIDYKKGYTELRTNSPLNTSYFLDNSGLYGWHNNGLTDFDGSPWVGEKTLTENGTGLTATTNHLGETVYAKLNGTDDYMSSTDDVFAATGSFRISAWIKDPALVNEDCIAGMYHTTVANRSWLFYISGSGSLIFTVYVNSTHYPATTDASLLADGEPHYVEGIYNQTDKTVTLMVDGKIMGHRYHSDYASRTNDTTTVFMVGAYDVSGAQSFFDGDIFEVFYQNITDDTINWKNESRKAFAAGALRRVTKQGNGKIVIHDGRANTGSYKIQPGSATSLTATSFTDVANWILDIPESGQYKITATTNLQVTNTDEANDDFGASLQVVNGSTPLDDYAYGFNFNRDISVAGDMAFQHKVTIPIFPAYYSAGDQIKLQYKADSADTVNIVQGVFYWTKLD